MDGARWGVPGARNPSWGLSLVSAREMANLVAAMFDVSRLDDRYQDLAQHYLDLPVRDFAGGWRVAVGYDLPAGWYDGSKAGELYRADSGLNVHGVGLVEGPDGHRYAVAVLARGWEGYHASAFAYEELSTVGGIVSCLVASADPAACAAA